MPGRISDGRGALKPRGTLSLSASEAWDAQEGPVYVLGAAGLAHETRPTTSLAHDLARAEPVRRSLADRPVSGFGTERRSVDAPRRAVASKPRRGYEPIEKLLALGIDKDSARVALAAVKGDVEKALKLVLEDGQALCMLLGHCLSMETWNAGLRTCLRDPLRTPRPTSRARQLFRSSFAAVSRPASGSSRATRAGCRSTLRATGCFLGRWSSGGRLASCVCRAGGTSSTSTASRQGALKGEN